MEESNPFTDDIDEPPSPSPEDCPRQMNGKEGVPVRALYDYVVTEEDELPLKAGRFNQIIGWVLGHVSQWACIQKTVSFIVHSQLCHYHLTAGLLSYNELAVNLEIVLQICSSNAICKNFLLFWKQCLPVFFLGEGMYLFKIHLDWNFIDVHLFDQGEQ